MIEALYRASQAGVLTWLVIRGMCSLLPGKAQLAENITVKSTVGPVLEHARIERFGAGLGPRSRGPGVHFVGRLDARNLDGRAETLVPIENPTVHQQIPGQIMEANLDSDVQSWILCPTVCGSGFSPEPTRLVHD